MQRESNAAQLCVNFQATKWDSHQGKLQSGSFRKFEESALLTGQNERRGDEYLDEIVGIGDALAGIVTLPGAVVRLHPYNAVSQLEQEALHHELFHGLVDEDDGAALLDEMKTMSARYPVSQRKALRAQLLTTRIKVSRRRSHLPFLLLVRKRRPVASSWA